MELDQLVKSLAEALQNHTKAPGNQHNAVLLQQPGGMFSTTGLATDVISTHVAPRGLGAMIPALPSDVDDPRFGFLTGFSDDIGSEPVYPCDDAPTGYMKGATLTAQFGRLARQTNTIEVDKLLHRKRGANNNLRLMNAMLTGNVGMPSMSSMTETDVLNLVVKAEMVSVGVRAERKLARMFWSGSPAVQTAHGGYKEFPGLDAQIATGQVDAETNTLVPSADSMIYNFNFNNLDSSSLDIVEILSMAEFQLRDLADRTNMNPVTWVLTMRPETWFELSAIWACRYLTHRCAAPGVTGLSINITGSEQITMRDEMRTGNYIIINGNRYQVVLDDGIFEYTNANNASVPAGHWASAIYFVPLRVRGNFPALYWEHIDYTELQRQLSPLGAGMRNTPFWTDNGRWLWVYRENGYCFDLQVKTEPRVILRTPHLAAKIQNVRYHPMEHLRSPFPDSPYWKNGGVSFRPEDTDGYAIWN